jgi:sulfur carrier protein ThiS
MSHDRLRRVVGLSPETLADVLKGLVMTGQVVVVKLNGQMTYRATM